MLKALVVDDSRVMRVATARGDGAPRHGGDRRRGRLRAIERFREDRPDMVLIDVRMPGMDGYDVVRELRKLSPDWVPIIFVSAIEQEHGVGEGDRGGRRRLPSPSR
jgi:CheY-like chemotaxis protein